MFFSISVRFRHFIVWSILLVWAIVAISIPFRATSNDHCLTSVSFWYLKSKFFASFFFLLHSVSFISLVSNLRIYVQYDELGVLSAHAHGKIFRAFTYARTRQMADDTKKQRWKIKRQHSSATEWKAKNYIVCFVSVCACVCECVVVHLVLTRAPPVHTFE